MTIFWISNGNDFANFTEHMDRRAEPDMVEKPITFGEAEACGPNVVEKPITMAIPQAFCSF